MNRPRLPLTIFALVAAVALAVALPAAAEWREPITSPLWALKSAPGTLRWIEIHNLRSAPADGMFHVEVLERRTADPAWQIKHRAGHLAVTDAALRASIVKPLKRGAVYPETYDSAYAKWVKDKEAGQARVCDSTILACLPK